MEISNIKEKLKNDMTRNGLVNKRYYHSLEVASCAKELVEKHNLEVDANKAYLAGLLHDATKLFEDDKQLEILYLLGHKDTDEIMKSRNVWHGETAYYYLQVEYGIKDIEILNAVRYHVMGRPNMTILEKVIFIADYIENTRIGTVFEKARKIAYKNLDEALLFILKSQVDYITSSGNILISQTLKTYEYYQKGDNDGK